MKQLPNRSDTVVWVQGLLAEYETPLLGYATRLLGDAETARDVVQDTFLRLCKADRARINAHAGRWLFTVCRNRSLDVLRKESRMQPLSEAQEATLESNAPPPAAVAERKETRSQVLGAIDALPSNQREVIHLKFQEGMSYKEISSITGLSVSNVGYLLHTGIKKLRTELRTDDAQAQEV
jgi:RNA polymerase sigma-70 factor (ECF subfamily)